MDTYKIIIAILLIILTIIIHLIFKNPFKYPYYVLEFDASGKRLPNIYDFLDNHLNTHGIKDKIKTI